MYWYVREQKQNQKNHLKWNIYVAYSNCLGIPMACLTVESFY